MSQHFIRNGLSFACRSIPNICLGLLIEKLVQVAWYVSQARTALRRSMKMWYSVVLTCMCFQMSYSLATLCEAIADG